MKIRCLVCFCSVVLLPAINCHAGLSGQIATPAATFEQAAESKTNALTLFIPAADERFHYEGRIDFSNSNSPVIIWQASRIRLDFDGPAVRLLFDDPRGQNYFNAQVDSSNTVIEANEGGPIRPEILSGFGPGRSGPVYARPPPSR